MAKWSRHVSVSDALTLLRTMIACWLFKLCVLSHENVFRKGTKACVFVLPQLDFLVSVYIILVAQSLSDASLNTRLFRILNSPCHG
jgi:hypothetical protein